MCYMNLIIGDKIIDSTKVALFFAWLNRGSSERKGKGNALFYIHVIMSKNSKVNTTACMEECR